MKKSKEKAENLRKRLSKSLITISAFFFLLSMFMIIAPNFEKTFANKKDKAYVAYIEQANAYYNNDLYDDSLTEFDKALAIHNDDPYLYSLRSQSYRRKGEHEKAIAEAKKGISVLNNKSVYYRIKGYYRTHHLVGLLLGRKVNKSKNKNSGIAAYLYLYWAESAVKLGRYKEATEAYTGLIENATYTYSTAAYFKRGLCYYYIGDIRSALKDFYKHKEVINQYLRESANNSYSNDYSEKDIKHIEKWIKHCEKELRIKPELESNNGMFLPPDVEKN